MVGCSSNYIIYMDDTIFYATAESEPVPVDHEYSWRKARWAAPSFTVGGGILCGFPHNSFVIV